MTSDDVEEVLRIIRLHDSDDVEHARRYFEDGSALDGEPRYGHVVVEDPEDGRVIGVSGYGADTGEGQDIYWLGWTYVNPWKQGMGLGSRLFDAVMDQVRGLGGRKIYAETSASEKYAAAVRFYRRKGFVEEGRLLDFYGRGEDKLVLGLTIA